MRKTSSLTYFAPFRFCISHIQKIDLGHFLFMENKSYSEKLKDPRWQRKRLEIMQRDNFKCKICCSGTTTLNIHHKSYRGEPWEQDNSELETLCEDCHGIISIKMDESGKYLTSHNGERFVYYFFEKGIICRRDEIIEFIPKIDLYNINKIYNEL